MYVDIVCTGVKENVVVYVSKEIVFVGMYRCGFSFLCWVKSVIKKVYVWLNM